MTDRIAKKPVSGKNVQESTTAAKELYDWVQCFVAALIICIILFAFFIRIIDVVGGSMNPTLINGDKMLVSGLLYKPKVGDVVVFKKDEYDPEKALVKRVIAVEGQEINIDFENGIIYITETVEDENDPSGKTEIKNTYVLEEDYILDKTHRKLDFIGPKKVPEGCVFVMGDNRNASIDSRKSEIGMVDTRLILGKAYCVLYPVSGIRWIN